MNRYYMMEIKTIQGHFYISIVSIVLEVLIILIIFYYWNKYAIKDFHLCQFERKFLLNK